MILKLLCSLILLSSSLCASSSCLYSLDDWKTFSPLTPQAETFPGDWKVSARYLASGDDSDGLYTVTITHAGHTWSGGDYPGQSFLVGHLAGNPGKLVTMVVSNISNGMMVIEWKVNVFESTPTGITLTATESLMDGGKESLFQDDHGTLGILKTFWKWESSGGDWYYGQILWLKNGHFEADPSSNPIKPRRLFENFEAMRIKDLDSNPPGSCPFGKPAKWLKISSLWCQ